MPKETITAKTGTKKGPETSFSLTLSLFLDRLPVRSRKIVEARFGIGTGAPKTLEEIGQSYQITRERVRQVIGTTLNSLAKEKSHPSMTEVTEAIQSVLRRKNGVVRVEELLEVVSLENHKERGALLVFIESLSVVEEEKATKEYEQLYRLKDFSLTEWKTMKDVAKDILTSAKDALEGKELHARFHERYPEISEKTFFDFLAVAKEIKQNVFGKWGLSDWSDIKPRGTREKAHLVLKTSQKPLHFREIARLIDSFGLQKKKHSHPQTVHNELIKDMRFVLVGRGIYALSDWGYKKGTVKEVISEILAKASKPLSREEILTEVLKVRQVKKSTVVINLNTFFARMGKNAYTIKKEA